VSLSQERHSSLRSMALYGIETESESRTDVARRIDRDIVGTGTLCSEAGEQVKIYDKSQRGQGRCEGSSICIEREYVKPLC